MKKTLLGLALCFIVWGCSDNDQNGNVNIRLQNVSDYTLEDINFRNNDYGTLAPSDISEYQSYTTTYSYGYYRIGVQDTIFEIFPIDFVGETPLPNGNYTYRINVIDNETPIRLFMTFDSE